MKTSIVLKSLLTATLMSSLVACAPASNDNAQIGLSTSSASIIGGEIVGSQDVIAKSTVAIIAAVKGADDKIAQYICTGSLISSNVVLTAAHCVPQKSQQVKQVMMVVVFAKDINKATQKDVRAVTAAVRHQDYGKDAEAVIDTNDIALLKIDGTAPQGYSVAKFLGGSSQAQLTEGKSVTLAGYGLIKTDGTNTESDNTLRKVDVEVIEHVGKTEVLLDQNKGKGACHGDSGGPAFLNVNGVEYVWGITSRGFNEQQIDNCTGYVIYTKVKAHAQFIKDTMAKFAK